MNSPFNQEQAELLNRLLPTLTASQKAWLSGYLAAVQTADAAAALETLPAEAPAASPAQPVSKEVTILFGSQTGNAQGLAENAAKTLTERGFQVTVSAMSDFKPNQLKKLKNLLIVVSTHGEGDPPDNALSFHEFLHGRRAPKLDDFRYSVLALGDTSYEFFCQTGKEFDQRLGELGGTRLHPRVDCDLDYDEPAAAWLEGVISSLNEGQEQGASSAPAQTAAPQAAGGETVYSRKNPFRAEVLENLNLNGRGSNKETRHLELSLEGSGLTYEPGDALGIFPENDPELVNMLLAELKWDPNATVTVDQGENLSLKEALTSYYEITVLTKKFIQQAAELIANEKLRELVAQENADQLKAYIAGRDLIDFVQDFGPIAVAPQDFVSILRKIPPRLYSIASSFAANPDEVHLTIGAVRYNTHGRDRKGVCSVLCAERLQPGDTLPVFIQPNKNFKLPENPEAPIIMVGPGTGVAPFRSFMQEREETGAPGKSWMFFGDQHFVTDFLYQTEWQKWLSDGVLTKMDVAFSRDTEEKVYVQHRMLEHSKELFEWLEEGATFYVCGDKNNMAKDVQNALLEIIEKEGGKSREEAEAYLAEMKKQKRYQRDVY
ncbi:Sulfite reductase [NADPH] flavoprotein alpha-component [Bacillus paralicheniformis]|jgi:sulfite reductase (NADPH) flavoprotein alpha-component|uniref:Sulfite reductase [NADPH] flavoprotein alpha-component n=2 Tax=Bacillaceae TaxID=186817 RepID=A0ABY3FVQ0_9BACI|nr:Sulfite reductase [NADPH] flavoprotein alpha-component [Bacillus paralicheniformis]TWL14537.1 Sulfite reductase [NADPH] flavoprotein alpha-component [Bacillus paralicheniformis]TWL36683.1 Sulfite reductase [NADPH] flavoprotein alpha-component [Bacillus paralicheniformis]TWL37845.1 Sulfite reductase [NADPH] flavoprotein alpha-component [Bacillus paralicheniformis]TWL51774.1 Sulfite reductase [NADPH] flavoprotein alpha-component [Bacillus paralicheniformis]